MSQDLLTSNITIPLVVGGTLAAAGTWTLPILALPGTANGGGITLVKASYAMNAALAVGSAPAVRLVTLNSSSLPIATVASNGSTAFTAGTAQSGTISTAWIPGTVGYLGIQYGHAVLGAATSMFLHASISYFHGRGSA